MNSNSEPYRLSREALALDCLAQLDGILREGFCMIGSRGGQASDHHHTIADRLDLFAAMSFREPIRRLEEVIQDGERRHGTDGPRPFRKTDDVGKKHTDLCVVVSNFLVRLQALGDRRRKNVEEQGFGALVFTRQSLLALPQRLVRCLQFLVELTLPLLQERHFISLLLKPLPVGAFGGGVKKEQPHAVIVSKKMKVRDTPAGQFDHGNMKRKLRARQQTFHELKLLGNRLADAERRESVMFDIAALGSHAKLGVDFHICDRVPIGEEVENPTSDLFWQSMHGLFCDHQGKLMKRIINMLTRERTCQIDLPSTLPQFVNLTIRYCPPIGQIGFVDQQYKRHSAEFGLDPFAQRERHGKGCGAGSIDDEHEPGCTSDIADAE